MYLNFSFVRNTAIEISDAEIITILDKALIYQHNIKYKLPAQVSPSLQAMKTLRERRSVPLLCF
jgi:hypothetical protein